MRTAETKKFRSVMRSASMAIAATTLAITAMPLAAQDAPPAAKTAVYLESLGNGGLYSVNVDRRLSSAIGIRIGIASWSANDWWSDEKTRMLTVPAQVYFLTSPAGAHHFEAGGGIVIGHRHSPVVSGAFSSLTATIGYRLQRSSRGFVFRAGFTPFLSLNGSEDLAYPDKGFFPSIGLSFGRAF